jgi:hypothetical protein
LFPFSHAFSQILKSAPKKAFWSGSRNERDVHCNLSVCDLVIQTFANVVSKRLYIHGIATYPFAKDDFFIDHFPAEKNGIFATH